MADKEIYQYSAGIADPARLLLTAPDYSGAYEKLSIQQMIDAVPASSNIGSIYAAAGFHYQATALNLFPFFQLGNIGQAAGRMYVFGFATPATTITGIWYGIATPGVFTAANFSGFALYSLSGTTATLIAQTNNDATLFKPAGAGMYSAAFTSPVNVADGVYYIASLYNSSATTTQPAPYYITTASQLINNTLADPSARKLTGYIASQNTLPSTFDASTALTSANSVFMLGVY